MDCVMNYPDAPVWFTPYANIRTDSYVLLASLLLRSPSENLMDILRTLQWDEAVPGKLHHALQALRQAGRDYPLAAVEDEFNGLFVALGCGELEPCASWYREKKIHSKPLASLRSDLIRLGIVRQADCHDSEDHAGALCEIMAILSRNGHDIPYSTQANFYQQHIASWMPKFFKDLQSAQCAEFYRVVGTFGSRFLESESEYLKYGITARLPVRKGGAKDESGFFRQSADVS
jgi:TorA maturation chaperone TorD